jgi:hypothetical protein
MQLPSPDGGSFANAGIPRFGDRGYFIWLKCYKKGAMAGIGWNFSGLFQGQGTLGR